MKLKNVKVGQFVKVKSTASTFDHRYVGSYGTVVEVEDSTYEGELTVKVRYPDGVLDWGNHEDIKPIKLQSRRFQGTYKLLIYKYSFNNHAYG